MNTLLDKLNNYLNVLDKWEGQGRNKTVGAYSFLSDDLLVRSIVVCPNVKYGMSGLKTFLATNVLEIYRDKTKSKISYKEIQAHLVGDLSKKPKFNYDVLGKCGQREANREAFLKESRIMQKNRKLYEMVEKCDEWLPYILLDQIRKTAWTRLSRYNFVCEEEFCEDCEKKKAIYYQFTQAVALFEIFFIEYVQQPIREYVEAGNELLKKASEEIGRLKVMGEKMNEKQEGIWTKEGGEMQKAGLQVAEEALTLARRYEKVVTEDVDGMTEILDKISVFSLLEAEFAVELCAMHHLLLILESINVYSDVFDDIEETQIGLMLDTRIRCEYEKNFRTFGRTNENRSVSYRRVNEYLENMLSQYTDSSYDVRKIMMAFLEELSEKGEKTSERYYELMGQLAYPVYRKLGGEINK